MLVPAAQPVHSIPIEHRGATYRVDYKPHVETSMRVVGMSAGPRPSTQRCVVNARVSVERVIAGGQGQELKAMLPGSETFQQHLPGSCHGRDGDAAKVVAAKAGAIATHLARSAAADRTAALAAIDSAHHFAAN